MLFNCHTHHFLDNPKCLELVNEYPHDFQGKSPFFSVGIHPWFIDLNRLEADFESMEQRLQDSNCLAAGECGLDKNIELDFEKQQEIFERQLILAEKYQKPVILHCVAAYQEMVAIKAKLEISVPMIIHGFSKKIQLAEEMVNHGFYLSFGKHLMKNPNLEESFLSVPDDKFFLETDSSEDTIEMVYEQAAAYKKIEINELKRTVAKTFSQVFDHKLT